jgi:hypothetical protein
MDCDQTALSLPPVTSAVFLIPNNFGKRENIWDAFLTPSGVKRERYVTWYKTKSLPTVCPYVCLDLLNYQMYFDVFYFIERVIQEEVLFV